MDYYAPLDNYNRYHLPRNRHNAIVIGAPISLSHPTTLIDCLECNSTPCNFYFYFDQCVADGFYCCKYSMN